MHQLGQSIDSKSKYEGIVVSNAVSYEAIAGHDLNATYSNSNRIIRISNIKIMTKIILK